MGAAPWHGWSRSVPSLVELEESRAEGIGHSLLVILRIRFTLQGRLNLPRFNFPKDNRRKSLHSIWGLNYCLFKHKISEMLMRPRLQINIVFGRTILGSIVYLQWDSEHTKPILEEEESLISLIPTD